ncbi:MAG TPA: MBL fold metallo-hydrolase [Sedimenticola sp.]|nr:MBL fold metallo-hydrolase [Sedimenticola sp.]
MIERLVVTQLVENRAAGPGLLAEHGIAFFIEADGQCLLYDTGQGLALSHNVRRLQLPMASVAGIVLSHGHYDHAGGLAQALALTGPVPVWLHPRALQPRYNRDGRAIGAPLSDEKALAAIATELVHTREPAEILPGIHVTGEIPRRHGIEDTGGPFFLDPECRHLDPIVDDQALFIETARGLVVLLGCGHAGVINTLEYVQQLRGGQPIRAVIGGMHLLHASPGRLAFTCDRLQQLAPAFLAANHCTGLEAVCTFRQRFPGSFHSSVTGSRHRFDGGE